jgi:hypothetical protein
MNANQISYPAHQQSVHFWTPLLAAVLLAIALIVGAAGIAALTAKSGTTSPVFVPQPISVQEHATAPTLQGVPFPGGVAGPSQLEVANPAFVPQSVNSHDHVYTPTYRGVPYPGGVAGPSQVDHVRAPGMGGH